MYKLKVFVIIFMVLAVSHYTKSQLFATTKQTTATWQINTKTVLPEGKPANAYVEQLVVSLTDTTLPGLAVTRDEFLALLANASPVVYSEQIIKYATPRSLNIQNKEHADFAKIYQNPKRLKAGIRFLNDYEKILGSAYENYRVDKKDIVAILMWESGLGEFVGKHLVFNIFMGQILYMDQARDLAVADLIAAGEADSTAIPLAHAEKRRLERLKQTAVKNLASLLRFSKEKNLDATKLIGSWGGAVGYVQFMPSSMHFAVDGDEDGEIDLCTWPDAIYSVANYLHENGYGTSTKARRRAIRAYNPLDSYVDGIILYADTVWKQYMQQENQK